jgi:hypothetical protein
MTENTKTADLEARINDLEDQLEVLHEQLRQAELEVWQGRVDDLEVQVHLASLDVQDQLDPLLETLRNRWLDAREQAERAGSTAGDTLDVLRRGMEQAVRDVRQAIIDARSTVAG